MKNNTVLKTVKGALANIAPFFILSAAIALLLLWGAESFIEGNAVYRLVTLAPEEDSDDLLVLDEAEKEKLQENNKGSAIPADFPIITLGEEWAKITIESAEVWEVPVYHGDYEENLWRGIGHYSNSRFPGQGGKVVLSGHVGIYEFFQRLENMQAGDRIKLDTTYGEYIYEVTETVIFHEDDKSLLLPEETDTGDKLICYTCYPFRTTGVRTQRFAVICDLVSGKEWR